jgi:tRNA(fMet)-specific endonuclease VapC
VDLILDTNALSAVAEGQPEIARPLSAAAQPAIPVIVLGEYWFGIAGSRFRTAYEGWLKKYLPTYAVLRIDEGTAVEYARLRVELKAAGTPIPSNDIWIAALCRQHSHPILSRDRHFDLVHGLRRIAW